MAHSTKRRRLNTPPPQFSDDEDITFFEDNGDVHPEVRDRIAARNRFKSVLEGIFEKYGRDFTGVGDEIDLRTGELVVDNGHIKRMEDEGDVGERLGASEEELDLEDDSDATIPDDDRPELQDEDEQPLQSLNLDAIVNRQSQTVENSNANLSSQAKDPMWQVPDLPGVDFGSQWQHENEARDTGYSLGSIGQKQTKSPARSLWKNIRYSKKNERTLSRSIRSRRSQDLYANDISHPQARALLTGQYQAADFNASTDTWRKEITTLSTKTRGWSLSEEQQLMRYRLNTSLSYTALEAKFPGKTADMIKARWRQLKRKMTEVPAATTNATSTRLREIGTQWRGSQRHLGIHNKPYSPDRSRKRYSRAPDPEPEPDILSHPRSKTSKFPSYGREHQGQNEPALHAGHQNIPSALELSKQTLACATNSLQEHGDYDAGTIALSEDNGQWEGPQPSLQALNQTGDANVNASLNSEQHQVYGNTWNAFPSVDPVQAVSNNEEGESLEQMWNAIAGDCSATWQNHTPEVIVSPDWVPYGPFSAENSLPLNQNNPSPAIDIRQDNSAVDSHQDVPEFRNIITAEAGLPPVELNDDNLSTSSDALDLMALASDAQVQANYALESYQGSRQPPHSVQQQSKPQLVSQYPLPAVNSPARVTLRSTIPDTQDQSSAIVISSDDEQLDHASQAPESTSIDIRKSFQESIEPPKRPNSKLTTFLARGSSPLSSLSSSDPRIARPSDLSSSIPNKCAETIKSHGTTMGSLEPVHEAQRSLVVTKTIGNIDPRLLDAHNDIDQIVTQPRTFSSQSTISVQLAESSIVTLAPTELNVEASPKDTARIAQHHRQVSKKKLNSLLKTMKEADDNFQTGCDSLEESNALLKSTTIRNQIDKHDLPKYMQSARRANNARQPQDAVLPFSKIVKPNYKVSKRLHKTTRLYTRRIQESADNLFGTSLQSSRSTNQEAEKSSSFHQRRVAVPEGHEDVENNFNYAAFKDSHIVSAEDADLVRRMRETTPIDTYNYVLADLWFRKIPRTETNTEIPKAPKSRNEGRSKHRNSESLQHQSRCSTPPSDSASGTSEDQFVDSDLIQRPQIQKQIDKFDDTVLEGNIAPLLPISSNVIRKSNSHALSGKRQSVNQEQHIAVVKKSTKPSSTIFPKKNDHQIPPAQSSGHLVSQISAETPRKPSPSRRPEEIVLEFGKGRPLTRANLLSQDEIPSTSQETVLSFLTSQATQPTRPIPVLKPSRLAQHSWSRSVSSANVCGVNGLRCEKRSCTNCTSRVVSQEEVDF